MEVTTKVLLVPPVAKLNDEVLARRDPDRGLPKVNVSPFAEDSHERNDLPRRDPLLRSARPRERRAISCVVLSWRVSGSTLKMFHRSHARQSVEFPRSG